MRLNDMIAACVFCYLNSHLEVTKKMVYNDSGPQIMFDSSHSGSKTIIDNGSDISFLGED